MNIPSYVTWVAGTVVTAAALNSQVRDAGNFNIGRPYCSVYNNAGLATATGVSILLPFDSEVEDNDNMHSTVTNPSRITFNTAGVYMILPRLSLPSSANGGRQINLRLNAAGNVAGGTSLIIMQGQQGSSGIAAFGIPAQAWLYRAANVGDYIEMNIQQTSGGAQTTTTGQWNTAIQALWELA